jgi:hypothetical protein
MLGLKTHRAQSITDHEPCQDAEPGITVY